jgi:copper transport protein
MATEPLLQWSQVVNELASFLANFAAIGAIGFRFGVLRSRLAMAWTPGTTNPDRAFYDDAATAAAVVGLVGTVAQVVLFMITAHGLATRKHLSLTGAVRSGGPMSALQIVCLALALVGFGLAARRTLTGWPLAAIGVVGFVLRNVITGQVTQLVNPIHRLAGGLWIGTLFVMLIAGIGRILRPSVPRERHGPIVAGMVYDFSPVALGAAGVLVLFGLITAWRHLKYLAALWTTPYGWTLLVKLALVLSVVMLGAWNWRRVRPSLRNEQGATVIRRTAGAELAIAGLVLIVTSILVSLPSPKLPGH